MESQYNQPDSSQKQVPPPFPAWESRGSKTGRIFGGFLIIVVGVLFLLRQMGVEFPGWIISWPVLLIAISLYVGFRHSFKGPVWIIMFAIGSVFLFDNLTPEFDFHRFIWPIVLISIGLVIIFRSKKNSDKPSFTGWGPERTVESPAGDYQIDAVTIFGGVKKKIISKSFRGGDMVTILGGTELDLTQADVTGKIELELTNVLAGTKLIVPPHWSIQSDDMVSIFGGLDDKRPIAPNASYDPTKVLVLKGVCIFGGIDIKSY